MFPGLGTMMSHVCVLILVSQQKKQGPGYCRERAREPEDLRRKQRAAVECGRHHSGCLRQTKQESMQWSGKLPSASQQPASLFGKGTGYIRPLLVLTSIGKENKNKKRPNKHESVGDTDKKSTKVSSKR